jgi:hypothetical protein
MIKEDHLLACTTKMFEILACASPPARANPRQQSHDLDRPDRSSTPELPDPHPRGYPTIHLSKSTSNPYADFSSATDLTANTGGNFRYRRRVPRLGRRILASRSRVSTGVREDFRRASARPFERVEPTQGPEPFTGSGPLQLSIDFLSVAIRNARPSPLLAAVQAPQPTTTGGR